MKISVIIPAYNAEKTIERCIKTILDNDYNDFEVIIVDDNSKDNTKQIVETFKDRRLQFFSNEFNRGPSFSRNHAIKSSNGDLMLLLDADSYVDKNWIAKHAKLHKDTRADIIGGGVISIYKTIYGKCDSFCTWIFSIPYSGDTYLKRFFLPYLPTTNMSVKKAVFEKIEYFHENLRVGEDAEFCFRALKNGMKLFFKSDLIVYHRERDDFKSFIQHQMDWDASFTRMRKENKMDFSQYLPNSYFAACIYFLPMAFLYSAFITVRWLKYKPSIVVYFPLIFLAKLKQAIKIKNSFRKNLKH